MHNGPADKGLLPIPGYGTTSQFTQYEAAGQERTRPKPQPAKRTQDKDRNSDAKADDKKKEDAKKAKANLDKVLEEIDKILDPPTVAQTYQQTSAQ